MVIQYTEIKSPITPINEGHVRDFLSAIEQAGDFSFAAAHAFALCRGKRTRRKNICSSVRISIPPPYCSAI